MTRISIVCLKNEPTPKKYLHDPVFLAECLLKKPLSKVYVRCGIGVCATYLSRKYQAECSGITISLVPAERAHALVAAQGLANKVTFQVADALNRSFSDIKFDLVWSMKSGEHMPDKLKRQCEGTMPEFDDGERQSTRVDHSIVSIVGNFAVAAFSKACKKVWHAVGNFTVAALWPASVWSS